MGTVPMSIVAQPPAVPPYDSMSQDSSSIPQPPETPPTRRITVWNPKTGKRLSGNAGVMKRNLQRYLATHPEWEVKQSVSPGKPAAKRKTPIANEAMPSPPSQRLKLVLKDDVKPIQNVLAPWHSLLLVCSEEASKPEDYGLAAVSPMWSPGCTTPFTPFGFMAVG